MHVCVCLRSDFSEVPTLMFTKLDTMMKYNRCLIHVKQILVRCQNILIMNVLSPDFDMFLIFDPPHSGLDHPITISQVRN